jgi:hypothetical protein
MSPEPPANFNSQRGTPAIDAPLLNCRSPVMVGLHHAEGAR